MAVVGRGCVGAEDDRSGEDGFERHRSGGGCGGGAALLLAPDLPGLRGDRGRFSDGYVFGVPGVGAEEPQLFYEEAGAGDQLQLHEKPRAFEALNLYAAQLVRRERSIV